MRIHNIPRSISANLDFESLAAGINLSGRCDPGMRFARLGVQGSEGKHIARLKARDAMLDDSFRSFLTMPGLFFAFEHLLLQKREQRNRFENPKKRPSKTYIAALEREPHIYKASFKFLPCAGKGHIKILDPIPGSKHSVQTPFIFRYHLMTFEDYAICGRKQDAAFLDFNGSLSRKRIFAIRNFWNLSLPSVLVVNRAKGRSPDGWDSDECHERLLAVCSGGRVTDDYCYGGYRQVIIKRY